jgi:hypothetical protein
MGRFALLIPLGLGTGTGTWALATSTWVLAHSKSQAMCHLILWLLLFISLPPLHAEVARQANTVGNMHQKRRGREYLDRYFLNKLSVTDRYF